MKRGDKTRLPLTELTVAKLSKPGRYGDGRGLYLAVSDAGSKSWVFLGIRNKERHVVGLGPYPAISLKQAREKAATIHANLKKGIIPIKARAAQAAARAQQEKAKAGDITFGQAADELFERLRPSWRSPKHEKEWSRSLWFYCAPLRDKPVSKVGIEDVLRVVGPLWNDKVVTANRTRNRIEAVLNHAKAMKYRTGDNPATWNGGLEYVLPPPEPTRTRVKHHVAIHYRDVPTFIAKLRMQSSYAPIFEALEFAILTATRTLETVRATWDEINFEEKLWIIPARRMKAKEEHRIPLSHRALEILSEMAKVKNSQWIFPGKLDGRPLSDNALITALRRLEPSITTHGFRSAFRTWCYEQTQVRDEIAEAALAHTVGNQVRRAYLRGDALEERRGLMMHWAAYCEPRRDNVVPIGAKPIPA